MKTLKTRFMGASFFVLALLGACNSDFDKVIPESPELNSNIKYKKPKVLYIIADGARGTSVRDADIPVLKSLIAKSIYTWNSLADLNGTDATNWTDMMTGVKKEKHLVLTEDFADNKLADYPVVFQRIKSINPNIRVASFASSSVFKDKLTTGADVSESFGNNDEAVKVRMVDFLKSDTASFVIGQFSGINLAGKASGYDNSFTAYKTAIKDFDTRVGEIINSVKARSTYKEENWLIIITSNKGGQFALPPAQDDKTIFSNMNVNTFTMIYSESIKQTFIAKPFLGNSISGNAVTFLGDPEKTVGLVSPALSANFNFGDTASFTISVKIKKGKNPTNISRGDYYYEWPSILGKKATSGWGDGQGPGWEFSLLQNRWRFFISGGTDFRNGYEINGLEFSGDTWHDLTAVVERKPDGKKYVRVYTDGVLGVTNNVGVTGVGGSIPTPAAKEVELPGKPNFDNNAQLRVGYTGGEINGSFGKINVQLAEFKIWKAALPDAVVKQYACDPSMNVSHPYYANLLGYWPMNEGSGTKLADKGPFVADFTLQGTYTWNSFTSLVCSPNNTNLSNLVPKNSDLPAQILSWFNIALQDKWALDGKVWITN
ncbi:DUF4983 domain-containing protein [Pedobacter frigoris]|uniref:DUF4983 domain-containing protein n=1 Tax=Pedobacter frigoris TaxID=2571272 RepID=UPI00292D734B|nr:DUF4983 domain-containing protein [Pedobacter frigoris]